MPFSPPPSRPTPEVSPVRLLTAAGTGTFLLLWSVNSYLLLSSESLTKVIHIHCRKLGKRYESMKIISSFRIKPLNMLVEKLFMHITQIMFCFITSREYLF